jgi:hypothetical protein
MVRRRRSSALIEVSVGCTRSRKAASSSTVASSVMPTAASDAASTGRRRGRGDLEDLVDGLDDRVERRLAHDRRTVDLEPRVPSVGELLAQRVVRPALADAGVAAQHDRATTAAGGRVPVLLERLQQATAADERAHGVRGHREAALARPQPHHFEQLDGVVDALQVARAERAEVDDALDATSRHVGHRHTVDRCRRLDARRLERLARCEPTSLSRSPLSAEHDVSGVHADAHLELVVEVRRLGDLPVEVWQFSDQRQAGGDRSQRVILVGDRLAEVHQATVAHGGLRRAPEVAHHVGAPALVGVHGDLQVFGVDLGGQRRGADHVVEHRRHLPALTRAGGGRERPRTGRRLTRPARPTERIVGFDRGVAGCADHRTVKCRSTRWRA